MTFSYLIVNTEYELWIQQICLNNDKHNYVTPSSLFFLPVTIRLGLDRIPKPQSFQEDLCVHTYPYMLLSFIVVLS